MKKETLTDAAAFGGGITFGVLAAPALMGIGLTLLGAFSALIVVMLGFYIVEEATC